MSERRRVAVVGAGVSGLAAAWRAHKTGAEVEVFEASDRIGGVVRSERLGPWLVERGPHTMQMRAEIGATLHELGLTPLAAANGRRLKRYIARGGKLVALPGGPGDLILGKYFSWPTKSRILRQLLGKVTPPRSDLSFADFIRSRFGEEVLTWAAQPFVSGIYAGDAEILSTEHAFPRLWQALQSGSFRKAASRHPLISFANGLADLPAALAKTLPNGALHLQTRVKSLQRQPDGNWSLEVEAASRRFEAPGRRFHEVILTQPAHAASRLRIDGAEPLRFLAEIPQPPITSLSLGFPRTAVRHPLDGFGCLVPSAENRSILGIIFDSTLFPNRAPTDHVALTVLLGGALQPELAHPTAAEAWSLAKADVSAFLGLADTPPAFIDATHYSAGIPQYTLDHPRVLAAITAAETAHPGLRLAGNYRHGVSLTDCLNAGAGG